MEPYKVFINGGGSSPYDAIALENGWKLGANSGQRTTPKHSLFMVDNNWEDYSYNQHLKFVAKYKPHLATVRDIEGHTDQEQLYEQARELSRFCDRVVIIPKCRTHNLFFFFPNAILGLPLGRAENEWSWFYAKKTPLLVHLLGGSPKDWMRAIDQLGDKVYSLDGNYLSAIARYGKVYHNFETRKPHHWEVPDGKNYNYRCFAHSIQWVNCAFSESRHYQLRLEV